MAWIPFRQLLIDWLDHRYNAKAVPNASNHRVILTNGSTFTDASTMLDVITQEVVGNGYARQNYNPPGAIYDASAERAELADTTVTFTASGGTITYDRAVLITDAPATASIAVDTIDDSNNKLVFASAHGLVNNDKLAVTADAGGTVPAALLNSGSPQLLYVINATTGTPDHSIQLSLTEGGSAIDFGSGTGPIRVRTLNGNLDFYEVYGTQTITTTKPIVVAINMGDDNSDVTAA